MTGHFEEAFYRNKRAAVVSSTAVLIATWFSVHVDKEASIYIFKVDAVPNGALAVILMIVCMYLNLSYLLQYATDVPEWRRDPEKGLRQVEAVHETFLELRRQAIKGEEHVSKAWKDSGSPFESLVQRLTAVVPTSFPSDLENKVIATLKGGRPPLGEIYVEVFNQLSEAIRNSKATNLRWDELSDKIVDRVREKLVGTIKEQGEQMMSGVRSDVRNLIHDVQESVRGIKDAESERLTELRGLNQQLRKTANQLRKWRAMMNIRLRFQYLWFPLGLFILAILYGSVSLVCGGPAKKCVSLFL